MNDQAESIAEKTTKRTFILKQCKKVRDWIGGFDTKSVNYD